MALIPLARLGRSLLRFGWRGCLLLLSVTFLAFLLVEVSPLNPVAQYLSTLRGVSAEQVAQITTLWGRDLGFFERYLGWLGGVLTGEFGYSAAFRAPVETILLDATANSLLLMTLAWLGSGVFGYGLGLLAGAQLGRWPDRAITTFCHVCNSTPPFVLALVLLLVFGLALGWVPLGLSHPLGMSAAEVTVGEQLRHVLLPAATVALVGTAPVALHTRQSLRTVLESDMARFARARGLGTARIICAHGLRTSLLPALMLQCANLSSLIAGATLAEVVFSYHGLGSIIAGAALSADVPLLLGAVTVIAAVVFVGNAAADLVATQVDPRTAAPDDTRAATLDVGRPA